jgi:hypothetical protein
VAPQLEVPASATAQLGGGTTFAELELLAALEPLSEPDPLPEPDSLPLPELELLAELDALPLPTSNAASVAASLPTIVVASGRPPSWRGVTPVSATPPS